MSAMRMFEPGRIGSLYVRNRLVMPAMATNFASAHGEPTERLISYYEARAHGGVGMMVIENASIDEPAGGNGTVQLRIDHDRFIPGLSVLAGRMHEEGAAVALQINHAGAVANPRRTGAPAVGPSDVGWTDASLRPTPLTLDAIGRIIGRYAEAAVRAQRAGFDAVEVHGAHGYLIAQFLSPVTNRRTDAYGGSVENRWRFAVDVVRAVRDAVGIDYPILFRLSGDEFLPGGRTLDESVEQSALLVDAGIDGLSVSAGTAANPEVQLEPIAYEEGWRAYLAASIRKTICVPVITAGVFRNPKTVEDALEEGAADFVAIGRGLIADPEWPNKARSDAEASIRHCISCNRCVRQRVFDDLPIRCSVNPSVGYEGEANRDPCIAKDRRVYVIGGGPAGLQAAATASRLGADVTLYERTPSLGGQLRSAVLPPHKEKIQWLIDDLVRALPTSVRVRLDAEATEDELHAERPDAVILASGATPQALEVPVEPGAAVVTAEFTLADSTDISGLSVVVVGAGMVGCETALACAERGAHVTLVEALDTIGGDCEPITRSVLLRHLAESDVQTYADVCVTQITSDAVLLTHGREPLRIPADRVVTAVGAKPNDRLAQALRDKVFPTYVVGDARSPRGIAEAVYEGWRAGQRAAICTAGRIPNGEEE